MEIKKIKNTFSPTLRREETTGDEKRIHVRITLNWILNKLDMRVFLLESSGSYYGTSVGSVRGGEFPDQPRNDSLHQCYHSWN